jgi:SAF domain
MWGDANLMASDRGTLPRSGGVGVDQQAPWAEPTLPAGRRMPSAPRERKPLLAVVALILILVGGAGAGLLVLRSGQQVPAIELSQQVPAGQQFTAQDFTEVQVPKDSGLSYVPWDQAGQVLNFVAKTSIPAGTLLTPNMVTTNAGSLAGKDRVGVALKAGTMPISLNVGDQVELYALSRSDVCQTTANAIVEPDAQVLAVSSTGAGSALITVAVTVVNAEQVLCASANGLLGVVLLPNGSS